jgi:hypothetical protein
VSLFVAGFSPDFAPLADFACLSRCERVSVWPREETPDDVGSAASAALEMSIEQTAIPMSRASGMVFLRSSQNARSRRRSLVTAPFRETSVVPVSVTRNADPHGEPFQHAGFPNTGYMA